MLGHISKDRSDTQRGYAVGGTATYSALTAQRLGLQAAVVTACAPEDEPLLDELRAAGVWVSVVPSKATTTFRNDYDPEGRRTQIISAQAATIELAHIPDAWREAPITHLGPVAQELPATLVTAFPASLLGVTPQGWLRSWDAGGRVTHSALPVPPPLLSLPANAFLALSIEDLDYNPPLIRRYVKLALRVAITNGSDSARLSANGKSATVSAYPAKVVDPTGAGDVFAAALFIRYAETGDLLASAQFAHAADACAIEGVGTSAIPNRHEVERRVRYNT